MNFATFSGSTEMDEASAFLAAALKYKMETKHVSFILEDELQHQSWILPRVQKRLQDLQSFAPLSSPCWLLNIPAAIKRVGKNNTNSGLKIHWTWKQKSKKCRQMLFQKLLISLKGEKVKKYFQYIEIKKEGPSCVSFHIHLCSSHN